MDHVTYNSAEQSDALVIRAPYFNAIRPTRVNFEREGVAATVDSLGHIEFFDQAGCSLGFVDVPAAESPDMYGHSGQYGEVRCMANGNAVRFCMPIYEWDDYYPHCDGEGDRWNRREVRSFDVVYDCRTKAIAIEGR